MTNKTVFISYCFTDIDANKLLGTVRSVITRLKRVTIVDGRSLNLGSDFSGEISEFIRDRSDCVIAILLESTVAAANVLFEVGVAIGARKDLVIIAEAPERLPAMLRAHDAVLVDRRDIDWKERFEAHLERKLRNLLRVPSDHVVDEKLRRRYLDEEVVRLSDANKVRNAMEVIRGGDLLLARAILDELRAREPSDSDVCYLLADTLYLIGCSRTTPAEREPLFEEQHRIANEALRINPRSVLALNVKGNAEVRLGRLSEARETLLVARRIDSTYSVPVYNLACLHAMLGERVPAVHALREAISMNPIWEQQAKSDPDFIGLREVDEWMNLVYRLPTGELPSTPL